MNSFILKNPSYFKSHMKEFLRRSLRRLDVDIRRASFFPDVMDFINDRRIDVVLDIGANVGQFGSSLRAKGYCGKIVSFEPVQLHEMQI